MEDAGRRLKDGKQTKLFERVWREWDQRPSGLVLPRGKIVKRFEGERIYRIAWKITRGLFFDCEGVYLPEDTPNLPAIVAQDETPPEWLVILGNESDKGTYPGVFNYRYRQLPEIEDCWVWANLFWDAIVMGFFFHDPRCTCETCLTRRHS